MRNLIGNSFTVHYVFQIGFLLVTEDALWTLNTNDLIKHWMYNEQLCLARPQSYWPVIISDREQTIHRKILVTVNKVFRIVMLDEEMLWSFMNFPTLFALFTLLFTDKGFFISYRDQEFKYGFIISLEIWILQSHNLFNTFKYVWFVLFLLIGVMAGNSRTAINDYFGSVKQNLNTWTFRCNCEVVRSFAGVCTEIFKFIITCLFCGE